MHAERVDEDLHRRGVGLRGVVVVADGVHQSEHQDQPGERGVADRPHDAARGIDRRLHSFFGHVETAVEAGERPAGDEQSEHSAVNGVGEAGVVGEVGGERRRLVVRGNERVATMTTMPINSHHTEMRLSSATSRTV